MIEFVVWMVWMVFGVMAFGVGLFIMDWAVKDKESEEERESNDNGKSN